jgi:hypothetical protein
MGTLKLVGYGQNAYTRSCYNLDTPNSSQTNVSMADGKHGSDSSTINDNVIPENSSFIFLLIHSDDIIIVSHSETIMNEAKSELLNAFQGTDNGNLTSFCGVEVRTSDEQTSLSMEYYWNKLMRKFNVKEDEVENSPIKTKIKRSKCPAEPDPTLKNSYLQIIGSIIYGYTHCRLDLAFPVNMLTRIMHSPAE